MSLSVGSNAYNLTLLRAAYQVGRYVQSFVTENPNDGSGKPWCDYSGHFRSGPNPYCQQTKKGLVLEGYYGSPLKIHTPYGGWFILTPGEGNWDKVMRAIKGPLGLEFFQGCRQTDRGCVGPYWAIRKWNDLRIDRPVYREPSEYIPDEKAREVWEQFALEREDLSPKW